MNWSWYGHEKEEDDYGEGEKNTDTMESHSAIPDDPLMRMLWGWTWSRSSWSFHGSTVFFKLSLSPWLYCILIIPSRYFNTLVPLNLIMCIKSRETLSPNKKKKENPLKQSSNIVWFSLHSFSSCLLHLIHSPSWCWSSGPSAYDPSILDSFTPSSDHHHHHHHHHHHPDHREQYTKSESSADEKRVKRLVTHNDYCVTQQTLSFTLLFGDDALNWKSPFILLVGLKACRTDEESCCVVQGEEGEKIEVFEFDDHIVILLPISIMMNIIAWFKEDDCVKGAHFHSLTYVILSLW